jgi:uncharacterized membrane protein YphA (DoxX/SURF4 family)
VPDVRRITTVAIVLLVVLRISIGWQLLYEGLWKIDSYNSPKPWTAEGYLKNAQGPFRSTFRNMTGDPDDRDWLDYDKTLAKWEDWRERFIKHYSLSDSQTASLDYLLYGPKEYATTVEDPLPDEDMQKLVDYLETNDKQALTWNPETKSLAIPGDWQMTPAEYDSVKAIAVRQEDAEWEKMKRVVGKDDITPEDAKALPAEDLKQFKKYNDRRKQWKSVRESVETIYSRSRDLGYQKQLLASLKGDHARITRIDDRHEGSVDHKRLGEIDLYLTRLDRYEEKIAGARTPFEWDHLDYEYQELMSAKADAVGPVKKMDADLKQAATRLLTDEQRTRGPLYVPTPMYRTDQMTIWALTGLGLLLIFGLFTRVGALAAAGMVFSFYLVWPPLPGVPEPPGTEHSFIVNKNLIEVFALLAIAALPTGSWFGLDGLIRSCWLGFKERGAARKSRQAAESSAPAPSKNPTPQTTA